MIHGAIISRRAAAVLVLALASSLSPAIRSAASSQGLAWGSNSYGQTNVPPEATNVLALAGGDFHCLALRADGTVVRWGAYLVGFPTTVSDVIVVVGLGAGTSHGI